jgi:hypothetical protein
MLSGTVRDRAVAGRKNDALVKPSANLVTRTSVAMVKSRWPFFQPDFDLIIPIAIMILIENSFRINQTLIEKFSSNPDFQFSTGN